MSLLNDMLRDLSHLSPSTVNAGTDGHELLQETRLAKSERAPWLTIAVLFLLIFFSVIAIKFVISKYSAPTISIDKKSSDQSNASTEPIMSKVSEPSFSETHTSQMSGENRNQVKVEQLPTAVGYVNSNLPQESPAQESPAQESQQAAGNIKNNDVSEFPSAEQNVRIMELFQQANRALAMDRLTSPVEDNAYSYYQKIVELDASHAEAHHGIEGIAQRYLEKAQEQTVLGNHLQANVFIERARFVAPEYVSKSKNTNSDLGGPFDLTTATSASQLDDSSDFRGLSTERGNELNSHVNAAPPPASESIKSLEVTEAAGTPMTVVTNAAWKDQQIATHARELSQQGKTTEALAQLKNFIASEQKPIQSTVALSEIYLQQRNFTAAEILATQAEYLPAIERARISAQVLDAEGKSVEAVSLLEKYLDAPEIGEGFRALLASLYHKTGDYQKSVISYQRLLNNYGEKPAYWLGVALAYDGLSQYNNALQAYLRLRDFPQLQDQVRTYIEQRITLLRKQ
ncbi:MAG: hypothetical protein EOO68_07795 [Moraxellaceae bacterium]|nr:MAG: hypothetical protein EOO68_07795 [Moraxellaceae bacterium]